MSGPFLIGSGPLDQSARRDPRALALQRPGIGCEREASTQIKTIATGRVTAKGGAVASEFLPRLWQGRQRI